MVQNQHLALTRSLRASPALLPVGCGPPGSWLAGPLLGLLISINGLNVVNSYVGRDFMTAIADRHHARYARFALAYLGVFAASTVVAVFNRFAEERLRLLWREWTDAALDQPLSLGPRLLSAQPRAEIDNPDQRITDDVKAVSPRRRCPSSSCAHGDDHVGELPRTSSGRSPRWLVLAAVVYAAAGTGDAIVLGRPLVQLNNLQLQKRGRPPLRTDPDPREGRADRRRRGPSTRPSRLHARLARSRPQPADDHRREPEPRLSPAATTT